MPEAAGRDVGQAGGDMAALVAAAADARDDAAAAEEEAEAAEEAEEEETDFPDELFCPITYTMMRDPVRALDGHVYERLAITRWFAQRVTSPMTGAALASTDLVPQEALRARIYAWALAKRATPEGAAYFSCHYCGDACCADRRGCRERYEASVRSDAARGSGAAYATAPSRADPPPRRYGAAARRRRWIEGNVLPPAERALRSGRAAGRAAIVFDGTSTCLLDDRLRVGDSRVPTLGL